ncbi:hypothetical protein [Pseudomonas sp. S3E12]|uniref:hypothetical protein n=1 Tax=Pseudomonas sp. S3E12 TaxID=1873126 RepID=UPI00114C976F|nr:hypothetical protein [Pseudomonas sp. S3E12]
MLPPNATSAWAGFLALNCLVRANACSRVSLLPIAYRALPLTMRGGANALPAPTTTTTTTTTTTLT